MIRSADYFHSLNPSKPRPRPRPIIGAGEEDTDEGPGVITMLLALVAGVLPGTGSEWTTEAPKRAAKREAIVGGRGLDSSESPESFIEAWGV